MPVRIALIPLALVAAVPMVGLTDKYKASRFKALNGHFSSYVYLAKHTRFEFDAI